MKIIPVYKDDTDKIITILTAVCTIFCGFIAPLITVLLLKQYLSSESYEISKAFLNFEIFLALISLIAIIPILGLIAGIFVLPILYIWNIIVVVLAVSSMVKKAPVNVPVPYAFI